MRSGVRLGVDVGDVCVPDDPVPEVDVTQLVIREFRRIAWPSSELVVQPRGGRTLVNFDTNFYTPDHRSIDQSLTIAGQSVVLRAMPVSYTYVFGDDTSTTTATITPPIATVDRSASGASWSSRSPPRCSGSPGSCST